MATTDPDSSPLRSQAKLETLLAPPSGKSKNASLHGKQTVLIALFANLAIGAIKLVAGFFGRHSAMISESMHSFADAINSLFLLIGLQKGSRAADKTHPYGYGLETTLWAMLASVMMLILSIWSMSIGVQRFLHPEPFGGSFEFLISVLVLFASIGLEMQAVKYAADAVLAEKEIEETRWLSKVIQASKHVRTIISPTTRFVFYEDTIALFGAIIALIAISLSQLGASYGILPPEYAHIPDSVASMIIGLMLLGLAIYLFLHNSKGLTGGSAGPQVEQRIRDFVLSLNGVSQVHDLRTIDYGLSGVVVQMRVEVDPDIQVKDVDDLTERIRDRVQARVPNVKEVIIEVLADETDMEWSDQFYRLIEQGRDKGVLKLREERILRNIYDFTHSVVSDIMVPRTDVDCIEASDTLQDLVDLIIETGHTRIPVYREDIDDMLGAIHAKDVFECMRQGRMDVALETLVRDFVVYPENKAVSDLLEEFKRKKIQIAMVADEHGGFAGIVTIEDLLEEIVGEIWDEYDEDLEMLEQLEPNKLTLSGRYNIDELNERYGLSIPDEEFNTIGGFVFGLFGREPLIGDSIPFEDLLFTVLEMDGHRVDKVLLEGVSPFVSKEEEEEPEPNHGNNHQSSHLGDAAS
jgi:cation diffusion facilitator family transporter